MIDPLAEVVTLLQPSTRYSKLVHGASPWRISRTVAGEPFYCAVLDGGCRVAIDGHPPIELLPGDFVLIPAAYGVSISSFELPPPGVETAAPVMLDNGEYRIGDADRPVDTRMMAGNCSFSSPDAALLVSLLPQYVHVRGEPRLTTLVQLVRDESRAQRPARELVLSRLVEVLLIEALRFSAGTDASPGLVRAADSRLAAALRGMHARPAHPWTVVDRQGSRAVALDLLRTLQPRGRRRADGIPAHLAHGAREEPAPPQRGPHRRDRGARGLQFREHLQRRVHTPRRPAARAIRPRRTGDGKRSMMRTRPLPATCVHYSSRNDEARRIR